MVSTDEVLWYRSRLETYFAYLVNLRDSGVTNMWGAAPYLAKVYPELTRAEASKVLVLWIESFEGDGK